MRDQIFPNMCSMEVIPIFQTRAAPFPVNSIFFFFTVLFLLLLQLQSLTRIGSLSAESQNQDKIWQRQGACHNRVTNVLRLGWQPRRRAFFLWKAFIPNLANLTMGLFSVKQLSNPSKASERCWHMSSSGPCQHLMSNRWKLIFNYS